MPHFSSFNTRWLWKFYIKDNNSWFLSGPPFRNIYRKIYIYICPTSNWENRIEIDCFLALLNKHQQINIFFASFLDSVALKSPSLRRGALRFSILRFWLCLDRFFGFFYQKTSVFRFWCSLQFAHIPFFSIWFSVFAKNTNGFSDLISYAVFGFSYLTYLGSGFLFDLSGNYAPPLISNSR